MTYLGDAAARVFTRRLLIFVPAVALVIAAGAFALGMWARSRRLREQQWIEQTDAYWRRADQLRAGLTKALENSCEAIALRRDADSVKRWADCRLDTWDRLERFDRNVRLFAPDPPR